MQLLGSSKQGPEKQRSLVGIGPFIEYGVEGYDISESLQKSYLFKVDDGRPQIIDRNSTHPINTLVSSYHKIQRLTGTFVRDPECSTGLRLLSENECKAIMGYPSSFLFPVSRTQMYRQLGNSVAVNVVKAVACELKIALQREKNESLHPQL